MAWSRSRGKKCALPPHGEDAHDCCRRDAGRRPGGEGWTLATQLRYLPATWARFWRPATVALDLGTDAFRLAHAGNRSLMEIPSRAVLDQRGHVAATGKRALYMEERLPDTWQAVLPVEVGHLSHPAAARLLIRQLLRQLQRRRLWKPRLILASPVGMTPMERTVLTGFLRELPVRDFRFAEVSVAQCLGAGQDPAGVPGMMVVDIGAQRTGLTILSFGRPVFSEHWPMGGHSWTAALRTAVEDEYRVRVPRVVVEQWKRTGGDGRLPVQDRLTGRLRMLELPVSFADAVLERTSAILVEHIAGVFTRCPPALRMDVQQRGILLVGNGSRLPGLRERLQGDLGLDITLPEDPGRCLVRGLARMTQPVAPVAAADEDGTEPAVDLFPLEAF